VLYYILRLEEKKVKAPLSPIAVNGVPEGVGVDILEMPLSTSGNKYVVNPWGCLRVSVVVWCKICSRWNWSFIC